MSSEAVSTDSIAVERIAGLAELEAGDRKREHVAKRQYSSLLVLEKRRFFCGFRILVTLERSRSKEHAQRPSGVSSHKKSR
jgi:hypothetical protein